MSADQGNPDDGTEGDLPADGSGQDPATPPDDPDPAGEEAQAAISGPTRFVLGRESSEVQLLLDHLSGDPTKNLLSATDLADYGLEEGWIEEVCRISWPPDSGQAEQAKDAALLIRAKNYLNTRARPATGATIAFTLLVAQEDNSIKAGAEGELGDTAAGDDPVDLGNPVPTRVSLARKAYPGLVGKAKVFRWWMIGISIVLMAALGATCWLSWSAAAGNAQVAQVVAAETALVDARDKLAKLNLDVPGKLRAVGEAAGPVATDGAPMPSHLDMCPPGGAGGNAVPTSISNLNPQLCGELRRREAELAAARRNLAHWGYMAAWPSEPLKPVGNGKSGASIGCTSGNAADEECRAKAEDQAIQTARGRLNVLGMSILPVLYGFLGAAAAVVRALAAKVRTSQLFPRDITLSLQQLALGAVVGACIGLFVSVPVSGGQQGISLFGPVTLSGSALSFVAGFGVESVFSALESLLARMFNANQSDPGRPQSPPRQ